MIEQPLWAEHAFRDLLREVKEVPGPRANARIMEYFTATSLMPSSGDETAWCAAGVNWCLRMDGLTGTNTANARSFLRWGVTIPEPRRGAITVLWRESPQSWKGHVGFYTGGNSAQVYLLGGNQGNTWSIRAYDRERVLGYRWPSSSMRYTGGDS